MHFAKLHRTRFASPLLSHLAISAMVLLPLARAQESPSGSMIPRTDRPEISVTVRDQAGALISAAGTVKLYRDGTPAGSAGLSHGRAFFGSVLFGSYTLVVNVTGYKEAQREVNVSISMPYQIDATLQRDSAPDAGAGVPAKPLLAPKAKEALDKALKALSKNNLSEAERYINEALQLAPSHSDVLYVQGVLFLDQQKYPQAQTVLEKASQMDPSNAQAFSALGMSLADQGKYDKAIAPLQKSVQMDAGTWETHWVLGQSYYQVQQYDQALKSSQLAWTQSNGKAPQIELLVAKSLTAVGKYEDSAQALRDFLKHYSDRPEAPTARRWLDNLARDGKIRSK